MKVFLGGTVNGSTWREYVMPKLKIDYFDPVVDVWNDEAYEKELYEKRHANYLLYVITPKLTGYFAIAEIADDAFHKPDQTVFCYLKEDQSDTFSELELNTLEDLGQTVRRNGGTWLRNLDEVVEFLNKGADRVEDDIDPNQQFDTFISYGRIHSKEYVLDLCKRFEEKNVKYWLDGNDIPLGLDKQELINQRILASNNFIFVISPQSVKSELCLRELEFAHMNKKNVIVIHHVAPKGDWNYAREIMSAYDWHLFDENSSELLVRDVVTDIQSDLESKSNHTSLLLSALLWEQNGRNQDDLLYGQKRENLDKWWKKEADKAAIALTSLQQEYLTESLNLQFSTRLINTMAKRLEFITEHKHFDRAIGLIALLNPISFIPQIYSVINDSVHGKSSDGVSVAMFMIFFLINVSLAIVWIRQRNKSMLTTTLLSIMCILTIVLTVLLQ